MASSTKPQTPKIPPAMLPLEPNLGDELVIIYVGDKRKKFVVHKKLICKSADYFKGAFTRDFEEASSGEIYMPEDSPGAFSLYIDWLYRGTITLGKTEEHIHQLYDLYIFAEKLCLTELMDKTMDAVQDMAVKYDLKYELITVDLVSKVLLNTRSKQYGLRRFLTFHMVFVYLRKYLEPGEEESASENEYDDGFHGFDEDDSTEYVMRRDMKKVYEIVMRCKSVRFLDYFVVRLMQQSRREESSDVYDPRQRDEGDAADRCFFHCHKNGYNCRPTLATEGQEAFIRLEKQNTIHSAE